MQGYPLGGYWARPITGFSDANGDGIIAADEVTVADNAVFRGRALPNKEASLNSTFALFSDRIRIGTQFDYRGGNYIDNAIESFRCTPVLNCRGLVDRTAPLEEQARAQAVLNEATEWGYFEPGWFIKMRELSVTLNAPISWARSFRASRLSITLAGPQPVHHRRLQRRRSRDQRVRAGQLRHQRLRVAAAGEVLHRAAQRRLLRG